MAKNKRRHPKDVSTKSTDAKAVPVVSRRGKKVIGAGVLMVLFGFWILTYVDPAGQNWAGMLSPALLVLGYGLIGLGIVLPDPAIDVSASPSTPA